MKHYFIKSFLFLAVLSVCFGFASCSDDEDNTPPPYEEVWTVQLLVLGVCGNRPER